MRVVKLIAVGGASTIQFVVLAVASLVLAKLLSVEDFAVTRVVTAYMVVLTMLGHFCLHDAVSSHVAGAKNQLERTGYVVWGTYLVVAISIVCALVAEVVLYATDLWHGSVKTGLAVTIAFLPVASLSIVYASVLQAAGSYRSVILITVLSGVVPAILLISMASAWQLPGWLVGRAASYLLLLLLGIWLIRSYLGRLSSGTDAPRALMRFGRVQIISGAASMLLQVIDVIVVERMASTLAEVAIYGLAAQFAKSVLFLPGALGRVFFVDLAEAARDGKSIWVSLRAFLLTTFGLGLCISGVVFLLGPPIIQALYKGLYGESQVVLKVMCLGIIPSALWTALSVTNIAIRRQSYSVAISVSALLTAIGFLALLVPEYGAVGAAWAMNASYVVGLLVGAFLLASDAKLFVKL